MKYEVILFDADEALYDFRKSEREAMVGVGDSLTSDIQGGINFDIDTCWYNPNKIINKTSIEATYELSNFDELKSLLLNL
ncbi:HAD hydrolase-like protein [Clostridium botulinum]|uniref:Conserved domain protein n=2 Tax=Clostridium botulinum TaxID=1491 RepID=A7GBQ5_CLOBL|nr:HAD hydrolase-like protein [Clostridium botulinum]ABS42633.1 conserved domain protein [Clostridium botulinum F str. Langeland]ADF98686.1 conserved domain protein [Clostridium botulinum F str. 230613]KKM40036.1 5'-nucleotidase [Clostridium botulinum]MBY6791949.1 HAD hydrolase-like protein [Clostridium botulinum]MBY6935958.1 HAD hydrolase-like protein [Clostridium botulinum]